MLIVVIAEVQWVIDLGMVNVNSVEQIVVADDFVGMEPFADEIQVELMGLLGELEPFADDILVELTGLVDEVVDCQQGVLPHIELLHHPQHLHDVMVGLHLQGPPYHQVDLGEEVGEEVEMD